ncbi:uncharacterized protein LOC142893446 isoform X2 [Nelusetta ayraudi]|uniref:uncharacterized protein LOC142893446 isoform X2 n=1 Tax=Nelusetta ayraudi TaxID=303726 RepID=UPI003F6F8E36
MKFLKVALYLTCVCLWSLAICQTPASPRQEIHFISASVGGTVTIQCLLEHDISTLFYWYKQSLGQEPRLISTFYEQNENGTFHQDFEKEGRFKLDTGLNKHHLIIKNLEISDSATYYCCSGYVYMLTFKHGTFVSVKDSGTNVQASVSQSPSQTVQSGDSVTLNCTVHTGDCLGEHSVYWFRDSGGSQPGLIYTQGGSNDQCGRKNDRQTQTCEYNLPMKSLSVSHTGTYYCAIASCGHILFGNGTRVDIKDDKSDSIVYVLIGALTFTTILLVVLAYSVLKIYKRKKCHCKDSQIVSASDITPEANQQIGDDLHYAAVREQKVKSSRRLRVESGNDSVYASVRE